MDTKTLFLESLFEEQMGFFCAHEYSPNLEELLEDILNKKQFSLFRKWKTEEANPLVNGCDHYVIEKTDLIKTILEKITSRLEALEEKQAWQGNTQSSDAAEPLIEGIVGIEKNIETIMIKLDRTEEKINKQSSTSNNLLLVRMEGIESLLKINEQRTDKANILMSSVVAQNQRIEALQAIFADRVEALEIRLNLREQDNEQIRNTLDSFVAHFMTIEASQAKITSRLNEIGDEVKKANEQSRKSLDSLVSHFMTIEVSQAMITSRLDEIEDEVKKAKIRQKSIMNNISNLEGEGITLSGFKYVMAPRVKMANDYSLPGMSVKKGEILGLLDSNSKLQDTSCYLVKIGSSEGIGFVPRIGCKDIGGHIKVKVPV